MHIITIYVIIHRYFYSMFVIDTLAVATLAVATLVVAPEGLLAPPLEKVDSKSCSEDILAAIDRMQESILWVV
jgi:hypothetical protein